VELITLRELALREKVLPPRARSQCIAQ
jgi:hypothetical protein